MTAENILNPQSIFYAIASRESGSLYSIAYICPFINNICERWKNQKVFNLPPLKYSIGDVINSFMFSTVFSPCKNMAMHIISLIRNPNSVLILKTCLDQQLSYSMFANVVGKNKLYSSLSVHHFIQRAIVNFLVKKVPIKNYSKFSLL